MSPTPAAASDLLAEVAPALPVAGTFHYRIPADAVGAVVRGSVVSVPFRRHYTTGYVVAVGTQAPAGVSELKPIHEVLLPGAAIPDDLFDLAAAAAEYYLATLGEVLRAALPATNVQSSLLARLSPLGQEVLASPDPELSPSDRELLAVLAERGPLAPTVWARHAGTAVGGACLRRLESRGLITRESRAEPAARTVHRKLVELRSDAPPAGSPEREKLRPRARALIDWLERERESSPEPVPIERIVAEIGAEVGADSALVKKLAERGFLRVIMVERERDRAGVRKATRRLSDLVLTPSQEAAVAAVRAALDRRAYEPFLLHGVTGSGKTLVYLDLIAAALERGQSTILLVPEIGLTPILARELRGRFGDEVSVLHSGLSPGERFDAWRRVRAGRSRVIFGARSAVWAPAQDLGLVVVDEEHDASYKQGDRPHYHARDLAVLRAKLLGIPILLGSATPSLESYENARRERYRLLELTERTSGALLPAVEVVDLRQEPDPGGDHPILSARLEAELERCLAAGEQALVLLNRRGYANFLLCRECGQRAECPNCSVALSFHLGEARLKCHHCGTERPAPRACPSCKGTFLHLVGHGTEKVERRLKERFPAARIARLDRDAARRRDEVERLLERFERGALDLLVGTQMVAKGHDFANVTVVGVISVDAMLALPDFRATERAFALLTQVAGRAGRGERKGTVILQTYYPDNEAIALACAQDYRQFFAREMKLRRLMRYPPTSFLVNLIVRGKEKRKVEENARLVGQALRAAAGTSADVLGPAMAPLERLKGDYRAQLLLRSRERKSLRAALARAGAALAPFLSHGWLDLDVDPQDLL